MTQDPQRILFYGRRKGKKMHAQRQETYETTLPAVQITLPDGDGKIDPRVFFGGAYDKIQLEVGFGGGEHLAWHARQNPDTGFIGCEPFINGVASLCQHIREHDLKNIRIWPDDARIFMPRLADASLDRCFVLNSDPWPKRRHQKRRFIQPETLDDIHRLLKDGAELRLSSDHPVLAGWQLEQTYFHGGFYWQAQCADDWRRRPDDFPETRYQKKGATQGRPTVFLNFTKI